MVGGHIAVLASREGSEWPLRPQGAIVLLEDVTEYAFRLDRFFLQLSASGALAGVSAIVLGKFEKCYVPADAVTRQRTGLRFFVPTIYTDPHGCKI